MSLTIRVDSLTDWLHAHVTSNSQECLIGWILLNVYIYANVHEQGFFVPDKGHTDQNPVKE